MPIPIFRLLLLLSLFVILLKRNDRNVRQTNWFLCILIKTLYRKMCLLLLFEWAQNEHPALCTKFKKCNKTIFKFCIQSWTIILTHCIYASLLQILLIMSFSHNGNDKFRKELVSFIWFVFVHSIRCVRTIPITTLKTFLFLIQFLFCFFKFGLRYNLYSILINISRRRYQEAMNLLLPYNTRTMYLFPLICLQIHKV